MCGKSCTIVRVSIVTTIIWIVAILIATYVIMIITLLGGALALVGGVVSLQFILPGVYLCLILEAAMRRRHHLLGVLAGVQLVIFFSAFIPYCVTVSWSTSKYNKSKQAYFS